MTSKKTKKQKEIQQKIKKSFLQFINSFKNKNILWVLLYDICFILITGVMARATSKIMTSQLTKIGLTNAQALSPEIISQQLGAIKTLAITFLIITIIFYIILVFIYAIFRAWIWTKLMNTKPTKAFVKKFYLLNLLWITGWAIIFGLGITALNPQYYTYLIAIITIAYIHLTTIMHHSFTWEQKIKKSLGKAFITGIGKIDKFIIPYIYIIVIYIVITKVFAILPQKSRYFMMFALILAFMAWYRTYMNDIIKQIEKKR
ncbi:hypothetical protein GF358_03480 [Candidatus Woesearchaeota archaeon]|nr:hypothetical protein [Candidatus Woesearchaeota archaeon]